MKERLLNVLWVPGEGDGLIGSRGGRGVGTSDVWRVSEGNRRWSGHSRSPANTAAARIPARQNGTRACVFETQEKGGLEREGGNGALSRNKVGQIRTRRVPGGGWSRRAPRTGVGRRLQGTAGTGRKSLPRCGADGASKLVDPSSRHCPLSVPVRRASRGPSLVRGNDITSREQTTLWTLVEP